VRAELEGYAPLERDVEVRAGLNATQVMRLAKLPGLITIDTGGVAAAVAVDGEPIGRAPGVLKVPAGARTFTLRAERHLDAVARLDVEGRGLPQTLKVALRSSWGKIRVESSTPGAMVAADDLPPAPAPATFDLAAGVHRIKVSAPGAKTWESTAIVAAGQTTKLGPILLGAPDTTLVVRSSPAGADVAVSGVFKGRTPLTIALPPGTSYDLTVSKAGYGAWSRRIDAQPGARLDLQAGLAPVWVNLTVAGEPTDAELFVDGAPQGKLPQTLKLTATRHAVEVRKAGMQNFATQVDLAAGVARTLDYRLVPEGRAADWKPPTERFAGKVAGAFRLVVPTSFTMGSERREQGRRPNETQRKVTFTRPFYIALREVTNGEYRRFRAGHRSGFLGKQSLDLDNQPVSSVAFEDAALYCNWLSQQEGLPEAYESRNGRMTLKQPATAGYRLPTEAEWEYAARYTAQGLRRYEWGNSLPWPSGVANLAGAETGAASGEFLADYRDDYPVVAPVGRFAANALGLHDMTGNVAEWVNDRYASFLPASAINDPVGPDTGRATVVRGASWRTASVTGLRLAARDSAEAARDDLGFRLARYAE
jgi:formylglycine-generating enzyme required for sulfatase activity